MKTALLIALLVAPLTTQTPAPKPIASGFGKDAYRIGDGVSSPLPAVLPKMPASSVPPGGIGTIEVEAVVMPDGTVGEMRVVHPLTGKPGPADDAAMAAVKTQGFTAGMLGGKEVPVIITTMFTVKQPREGAQPLTTVPSMQFAWNPRGTGAPLYTPVRIRVSTAEPKYTAAAMRTRVHGSVQVDAIVQPDGVPTDVRAASSLDAGLDDSAVATVKTWTFEAARQNDRPVSARITIAVLFVLH